MYWPSQMGLPCIKYKQFIFFEDFGVVWLIITNIDFDDMMYKFYPCHGPDKQYGQPEKKPWQWQNLKMKYNM